MAMFDAKELEQARVLLCDLGKTIRDGVIAGRAGQTLESMSAVAQVTEADTIYAVDKVSEAAVLEWFDQNWSAQTPVALVMEGLEGEATTFPTGTPPEQCIWKCIIDPIDGTRPLMYDKRSAWALCALAPQRGATNTLADICVAAMTELPTSKAGYVEQFSAVAGCGLAGVVAERVSLYDGARVHFTPRPSQADTIEHGFGQLAKFFPDGKSLMGAMEERLCEILTGKVHHTTPLLFDDQYLATGGQFYELLIGHDRFVADIRPEVYRKLGCESSLVCHPYDACCWLILKECGCLIETLEGEPLSAPLDTTSPVSWVAFANETLAAQIRPALQQVLREFLNAS